MMRDALLALGVLLSSAASQLRIAGLPIGPGEIFLAAWILLTLGREASRFGPQFTRALSQLMIFWAIFALALSLGTVSAFVIGDSHDPDLFAHDILAYAFVAAVSCLSVGGPQALSRLRRTCWLAVSFGAVLFGLQLATAEQLISIPGLDPWYWDRLRGWSENPNQLAFSCLILTLLSLHLVETTAHPLAKLAAVACALLPAYAGLLTKSDAYFMAMSAAVAILIALKFQRSLLLHDPHVTFRSAAAWIAALALPVILVSTVPLGDMLAVHAQDVVKDVSKNGGADAQKESAVRFQLWAAALTRGFESGLLGLGPGPHLDIPESVIIGRETTPDDPITTASHPPIGSVPDFEAHNTLLDIFTQGGVIAVASIIWLAAAAFLSTLRAKRDALIALLCGISVFGVFHLMIRYPFLWFVLALCLTSSDRMVLARPDPARGSKT